ncbi:hypothetical protein [Dysgonomonas sp. 520]|uniref:hypothetical protein n=1 Tax=Dysgonomonas sp. 520 TaxID=2302931 RepID=UPI0013CFBE76|nr:hypothetical protein [Dysgonomonas sp. 520]NDW09092.1 hypothetical protein [Dysgonomonas sp. 520]
MVALVFIYNHRFDKNIPILEDIYKDRFSNIFHLMPFYDGDKENVIPIYEHSFYFQGYIAQASKILKEKGNFEHFMFVGDDLLLHPSVNENNYKEFFTISSDESFTTFIHDLMKTGEYWDLFLMHKAQFFEIPSSPGTGLEISKELPSYEEALKRFKEKGFDEPYILPEHVYKLPKRTDFKKNIFGEYYYRKRKKEVENLLKQDKVKVSYPIVSGFSDLLIIPKGDFSLFARYCGLFAAARLFVELAAPTSMILTCKKIKTQDDLNRKGVLLWDNDREKFEKKYDNSFDKLFSNFPDDALYIHPVKLSKWTKN